MTRVPSTSPRTLELGPASPLGTVVVTLASLPSSLLSHAVDPTANNATRTSAHTRRFWFMAPLLEACRRRRLMVGLSATASPDRYDSPLVSRPAHFEHVRYLGDKRSQVVYDLDLIDASAEVADAVNDVIASEQFAAFGPDTLAEARNRGYRPHRSIQDA